MNQNKIFSDLSDIAMLWRTFPIFPFLFVAGHLWLVIGMKCQGSNELLLQTRWQASNVEEPLCAYREHFQ